MQLEEDDELFFIIYPYHNCFMITGFVCGCKDGENIFVMIFSNFLRHLLLSGIFTSLDPKQHPGKQTVVKFPLGGYPSLGSPSHASKGALTCFVIF